MWEYTELREAMEKLVGHKVDVIPAEIKRNPYFKAAVGREKELLYAA